VAPGTSASSNPNALATVQRNAIFTNVAKRPDGTVWWEGIGEAPAECEDWKGNRWTPASKDPAAHPNSRFTVTVKQCPSYSKEWSNPQGVPISAMIFGARRSTVVPLVYEGVNWQHGTYLGATLASETTAAATGAVGVLRRDPFAMLPFCGYNMADYFGHWLNVGSKLTNPPRIFRVNWFKKDENGKFLWPGFGQNLRVLRWIIDRCEGKGQAGSSPIGFMPAEGAIDTEGLSLAPRAVDRLFEIDKAGWLSAIASQEEFFASFGDRLPQAMWQELRALKGRL
jgi:phosphoenolpyruvate carboxykinase (GTP)